MSFESKPLDKGKIENLVKKQENVVGEYDQTENFIINNILNELPNSINTASLTKFCKNKVDKILENYPDKKDKADIVRNHIQKEIIFDLYNERFLEIKDAIDIEKPKEISPQWIRERFPATELLFRRTIKDTMDNVDWNFISEKLGVKDIFKYQEKKIRNEKEATIELEKLLEEENPETFSPIWIERKNDSLHTFFIRHFKDDNKKTNWVKAISGLSKKWLDKWTYRESERDRNLNNVITKLVEVLKEKNPEKFGPSWISTNSNKEYVYIQNHIRSIDGGIYWDILIDLLPSEFKEKWFATSRDRNWNYENAINRLETILKEDNPESFNSRWVEIKDRGLYIYFLRNTRNLTGIDWLKIIKSLPGELQKKWRIRSKNEDKSKFNQAINDLQELIKQKKPTVVTSGFIGKENPTLLKYFIKSIKNNNGEIDWRIVTNRLDEDTKKICRFSKRLEQYKPKKEYADEEELNMLIKKHENKLYTFFEVSDQDDYSYRDLICLDFINLVKKGNILAKEKFLDYLEILSTQWIERNKKLEAFKTNGDLLRERLEKCIYYYKNDGEKIYFLKYIHTSLLLEAKRLEIPKYIRLDDTYEGGKERKESRMKFNLGEE